MGHNKTKMGINVQNLNDYNPLIAAVLNNGIEFTSDPNIMYMWGLQYM